MTRIWKAAIPAMIGLALSASLLVAPGQAAVAAPALAPLALPLASTGLSVKVDTRNTLAVNPVAYGGSVVADFTKSHTVKKRSVQLQASWDQINWGPVKTVKMDSKGVAIFKVGVLDYAYYRAVANPYKKKKTEISTGTAWSRWALDRTYNFDGSDAAEWGPRLQANYNADGRQCSAPYVENTNLSLTTPFEGVMAGGNAILRMTKQPTSGIPADVKAACEKNIRKKFSSKVEKALLKTVPVYRNAMLSTQPSPGLATGYSMQTGIVAARIKFPKNRGMHAGVWLQSVRGPEIDMIESYGLGKGITNVYHLQQGSKTKEYKVYKKNPKSSWWKGYHTYSVEWTTKQIIFRLDGTVTKKVTKTTPAADYFLVMSLLSSDWELNKVKNGSLPATMSVDWVKTWKPKA